MIDVPIVLVGLTPVGLIFVVETIIDHAVGLDDIHPAVVVEVTSGGPPAETSLIKGAALGGFVGEAGRKGLSLGRVIHSRLPSACRE